MIEKEIKILNIFDINKEIERHLIRKGGKCSKDEFQQNIIYKKNGLGTIKLRRTVSHIDDEITYELIRKDNIDQGNIDNQEICKIKEENGLNIIDQSTYKNIQNVFNFIGLNQVIKGYKHRKSYKLNGFLYEIDNWENSLIPITYLEVEAVSSDLKIIDGLRQVWSEEEINNMAISTDSITDLVEIHKNIGIEKYIESLLINKNK